MFKSFVEIRSLLIIFSSLVVITNSDRLDLYTFLNTDINPGVIFVHDRETKPPAKILNYYESSHLISVMTMHEFLHQNTKWSSSVNQSISCNNLQPLHAHPEIVFIEMQSSRFLTSIFNKISVCLHNVGFKPIFVVGYLLETSLEDHLEFLRNLVVETRVSVNSQVFLVIHEVVKTNSSGDSLVDFDYGSNKFRILGTSVWEIYSVKNVPFLQQVTHPQDVFEGFDVLAQLRGKAFRRFNFYGATITGAAENSPEFPLESQLENIDGELKFFGGFSVDLFLDLEYALNFSAKAVQGEGWLAQDELTSLWTGTGRQVMSGEVDIGISLAVQYESRADFALLMPNYSGRVRAFFHQPDTSSIRDIFKHAFHYLVWIVMVAVFFFIFIFLQLTIYCIKTLLGNQASKHPELADDSALFIVAAICQQGWHMYPRFTCLKIIFACTAISGFVLYVSFSAALVSTLTNEILPIRIQEELLASKLSLIGDKYIPIVMSKLESIYNTDHASLENAKIAFDSSVLNPVVRIADEPCAYMGFSDDFVSTLRIANKSDKYYCDRISNVLITSNSMKSSMIVRKDSPFIEYFNYGFIKNIERGLNFARRNRYVRSSRITCDAKITSYREDLETRDVFSAYVILAVGIAVSLIAGFAEYFFLVEKPVILIFHY